jgi:hypothetical protein
MEAYSVDVETKMQRLYGSLSEKDRRRYAAVEGARLGHGGVEYVARVLGCDPKTIRQGLKELEQPEDAAVGRVRKKRGGRRPLTHTAPTLEANLRQLLEKFTAGDPMRVGTLWTNLSPRELQRRMIAQGTPASRRVIRRVLRQFKLGRRTARKKKTMGHHPDRNAQFENIARLRREYQQAGDPVVSIDTKKTALLGNFHRAGATDTQQTVETFDHDFGSAPAKTVADCFKYRNKIGIDVAIEALRNCLKQRKATSGKLWQAAQVCRMTNVMGPYLEATA